MCALTANANGYLLVQKTAAALQSTPNSQFSDLKCCVHFEQNLTRGSVRRQAQLSAQVLIELIHKFRAITYPNPVEQRAYLMSVHVVHLLLPLLVGVLYSVPAA